MKSVEEEVNESKRTLYSMHCQMFKGLKIKRFIERLNLMVKSSYSE